MHVNGAGAAEVVIAPHREQDVVAGEDAFGVHGEELQQGEFSVGQIEAASAEFGGEGGLVDAEVSGDDDHRLAVGVQQLLTRFAEAAGQSESALPGRADGPAASADRSPAHCPALRSGTAGSGRPGAKGGAVGWGPVRTGRGPVGTTRQSGLGLSGRLGEAGEELLNADGEPMVVVTGDLRIDETAFTAELGGRSLDLTYREFALLKFFAMHPERVFTRDDILLTVWGDDYFGGTRTVDVHVRRLRAKLGKDLENAIHTVRNVGYRFSADSVTDTDSEDETA